MEYMHSQGVTDIYELGAGKVLSGMVKRGYKDINADSACAPAEVEELAKNL